jgi:hypothetical protein
MPHCLRPALVWNFRRGGETGPPQSRRCGLSCRSQIQWPTPRRAALPGPAIPPPTRTPAYGTHCPPSLLRRSAFGASGSARAASVSRPSEFRVQCAFPLWLRPSDSAPCFRAVPACQSRLARIRRGYPRQIRTSPQDRRSSVVLLQRHGWSGMDKH